MACKQKINICWMRFNTHNEKICVDLFLFLSSSHLICLKQFASQRSQIKTNVEKLFVENVFVCVCVRWHIDRLFRKPFASKSISILLTYYSDMNKMVCSMIPPSRPHHSTLAFYSFYLAVCPSLLILFFLSNEPARHARVIIRFISDKLVQWHMNELVYFIWLTVELFDFFHVIWCLLTTRRRSKKWERSMQSHRMYTHRTHNIVPTQSNTLHRTKVSKSNGKKITCHHWILPFYSIVAVPSELSFSLEWIFDFSHSSLRFNLILNIFLTLIVTSDFTKRPFIETLNLCILYLFAETSSVSRRLTFPLSFLFINLTLNCHIFLEIFQSHRHISYLLLLLVKQMQQKPKYTNTYTRPD